MFLNGRSKTVTFGEKGIFVILRFQSSIRQGTFYGIKDVFACPRKGLNVF
jgi:hypothetical protein